MYHYSGLKGHGHSSLERGKEFGIVVNNKVLPRKNALFHLSETYQKQPTKTPEQYRFTQIHSGERRCDFHHELFRVYSYHEKTLASRFSAFCSERKHVSLEFSWTRTRSLLGEPAQPVHDWKREFYISYWFIIGWQSHPVIHILVVHNSGLSGQEINRWARVMASLGKGN